MKALLESKWKTNSVSWSLRWHRACSVVLNMMAGSAEACQTWLRLEVGLGPLVLMEAPEVFGSMCLVRARPSAVPDIWCFLDGHGGDISRDTDSPLSSLILWWMVWKGRVSRWLRLSCGAMAQDVPLWARKKCGVSPSSCYHSWANCPPSALPFENCRAGPGTPLLKEDCQRTPVWFPGLTLNDRFPRGA